MAYADRSTGGSKITALIVVAVLVAALGYAFISGLAYKYVKQVADKTETFDVVPPPPPPPEKVPPPPPEQVKQVTQPPPVVTPPPLIRTPTQAPPIQTVTTPPPTAPLIPKAAPPVPAAPVAPPPPPAPVISKAASARGNPGDWFSPSDYPSRALNNREEGRVVARWTVNAKGRVQNCSIVSSSGSSSLDEATCRLAERRGRYSPAKDQNGNPIDQVVTLGVRWKLPN